ncbi:MAG: tRNA (adenosine(37)-N6)-dimethylallyltransferase MiaA [Clostridia bacterium]|nr:tRNA (adenosine(37)-N6)-dimethylallyltransferase MiaA [Clostridia bacterium]
MADDIIVVCGPTASGKTALAVELAKRFDAEIVSADSMQIYKEMNIGTAKPSEEEKCGIPHHMIDIVSVTEEYNVSRYVDDAEACIDKIKAAGKRVILAGGTGLYIDSLINNVNFFDIANDYEYRERLCAVAGDKGVLAVHKMLESVDKPSADRLHPNDLKRVIRALEVYKVCGRTMTEIQMQSVRERKYNPVFIGLDYSERAVLYSRIEKRVFEMIKDGLLDEARLLSELDLSSTARAAIGYREMFDFLNNKLTFESAVEEICKKTRNYAKRQLTWFRKNKEINWLFPDLCSDNASELVDMAAEIVNFRED